MRRILIATTIAALALPAAATSATASEPPTTIRLQAAAAPSITAQRSAAFSMASTYARQANSVSWRQKARNADSLAKVMNLPGITRPQKALAIARTQSGTKYRWGGTTPAGFDCSGFTGYAYAKAGKRLPRTAAQQYRATQRTKTPAPGDLVFYGGSRAYHVGIYVGNGKMIHSPRTGKSIQTAKISRGASYGKVR